MAMTKAQKAAKAAAAATAAQAGPPASNDAAPAAPAAKAAKIDTSSSLGPKIQAPAIKENRVRVGDRTVVVVCKMPRGLYLQLTQFIDQDVKVVGGGVEKRKMPMRVGDQVRLKPAVLPFGAIPNYPIIDGFALTRDVDANFWNAYYEQNKNLELITSGLLCAFANEADATAYCREYGKLKTGLEPIAQKDDPRVEKEQNPNLTDIDIDTDAPRAKAS